MSVFDEIKERLDIVEIIGEQVQLRKSGRSYTGFCPFHHNTRTPAFTVFPDTQSFYCFGCHASGSVFDFVMRQQGIAFPEALEQLARRAGVQLRERTTAEQEQDQRRRRLLDINTAAAFYFNYILLHHRRGQPGRDYLQRRGINLEAVEPFQPGYSLNEWGHLLTYLSEKKGYPIEEIEATGLIVRREKGGWYDRFRGRLMFPIHNEKGDIVGFGGRDISQSPDPDPRIPKYLNTPQTLVFDKGRTLYGLHQGRETIRRADTTVVVEGYMDVLTAHQHGFANVVAPLGTAMTGGHVSLLKKLSHNVALALDADAAGQKATLRSIQVLQDTQGEGDDAGHPVVTAHGLVRWESDISLHIIKMPQGQDPDDVIRNDPQQWRDLVSRAVPVVDFFFDAYTADLDLTQPRDQRVALERLIPVLAELDEIQQRVYSTRLEQIVGVKAELIRDLVRGKQPLSRTPPSSLATSHHKPTADSNPSPAPPEQRSSAGVSPLAPDPYLVSRGYRVAPGPPPEDYLLALLLRYPSTIQVVEEMLEQETGAFPLVREALGNTIEHLLEQPENRLIWQHWLAVGFPPLPPLSGEQASSLEGWAGQVGEPLRSQLVCLAALALPRPVEYLYIQDAMKCARTLRGQQVRQWQRRLSQRLQQTQEPQEIEQTVALFDELSRYRSAINTPPHGRWHDLRNILERE
jgi:DNA primase